mmetsp:Transcript_27309/g.40367  ORF Transcript_27309/g.40367 Transcript_27309/m.40367 type:complete len:89 (-) Transcript_27309:579-845(-)
MMLSLTGWPARKSSLARELGAGDKQPPSIPTSEINLYFREEERQCIYLQGDLLGWGCTLEIWLCYEFRLASLCNKPKSIAEREHSRDT